MKELQISLYDVFGFIAPGVITFLGVYLVWWRLALPTNVNWSTMAISGWLAILLISYFLGHTIQALANPFVKSLLKHNPEQGTVEKIKKESAKLYDSIANKACRVTGIPANTELTSNAVYEIADGYLMQYGRTETRDIYVYREGFYRGFMVSLLIFMVGAFAGATGPTLAMNIFGIKLWCTSGFLGSLGIIASGMSFLSFQRFKRFAEYRVRNSLIGFLILEETK